MDMKNILKLARYLKSERKRFLLVTILSSMIAIIGTALPLLFKNIIDSITKIAQSGTTEHSNELWRLIILLAILLIANQILLFLNEKASDVMRIKMMTNLRLVVFPHLMSLSLDYTEQNRSGSILQKVNQGMGDFFNWLWGLSEWLMSLIFQTIFILIVLWLKLPLLGLVFTLVLPIMAIITIRKVKLSKPYRKKANKGYENQAGYLSEAVSNLSTIKSLSAEETAQNNYKKYVNGILKNRLVQFKIDRWHNLYRDSLGSILVIASVAYVSYQAIHGALSAGDVFLIAFYARDLVGSIQPISRFINDTADVEVTTKRLVDLLETEPTIVDSQEAQELQELQTIEFKNVSFTYPDSHKGAIHKVSFTIRPGKTIALVGPSGVGKSTITKLLLRYYQPTEGEILINGADISTYTQDSVRRMIGIVMQDVALFNASIYDNLAIAQRGVDNSTMQLAAKQAHADEFISELPKKYQTMVGERGIRLSGGQKQRVAIARAILKDPSLIILDEATSALDSQSEQYVQSGIKKLLQGRMSLIIAHRLSTIRHADEIIVLEKGQIEERGTHQHLLQNGSLYAKLYKMQSETGKVEL